MNPFLSYICEREIGRHSYRRKCSLTECMSVLRASGAILAETPLYNRATFLLRLSNNGELIAAAHGDRSIAIYSAASGCLLALCKGHESSPWTVTFHPNDPFILASGCLGGCINIWSLGCLAGSSSKPNCTAILSPLHTWRQAGAIASVTFHPKRPILIVAWTQEVVFYDWVSGRALSTWRFVSDHSRVRWVKLSPDGALLYTATANLPSDCASSPLLFDGSRANLYSLSACSDDSSHVSTLKVSCSKPCDISTPDVISRHQLLNFLVSQSNSWFRLRNICRTCSVRLCRWAGSLNSQFPSSSSVVKPPKLSLAVARQAALAVASRIQLKAKPLPFVVQQLTRGISNDPEVNYCVPAIRNDPQPTAVAIIEDLPAKEFLLSRGTYCTTKSPGVFARTGVCCGGHACDLVLAHRELMRHSLCRSCLQEFWRWACENVDWWTWNDGKTSPDCQEIKLGVETNYYVDGQPVTNNFPHPTQSSLSAISTQATVGVCVRCSVRVNSYSAQRRSSLSTEVHELNMDSSNVVSTPHVENSVTVQRPYNRTGFTLGLLFTRLYNPVDVTRATFLAPSIINDVCLCSKLRTYLRNPPSRELSSLFENSRLPRFLVDLWCTNSCTFGNNDPSLEPRSKRAKLLTCVYNDCESDGNTSSNFFTSDCNDAMESHPGFHAYTATVSTSKLVDEATQLVESMRRHGSSWNKPDDVRIISVLPNNYTALQLNQLEVFDYVSSGAHLLSSSFKHYYAPDDTDRAFNCPIAKLPTSDRGSDNLGMKVCCRCGRLVTHTFPVDPQSSVSQAVCTNLLFPGGTHENFQRQDCLRTEGESLPYSRVSASQTEQHSLTSYNANIQAPHTSASTPALHSVTNGDIEVGGLPFRNRNNSSVLNSMQQGITDIVAGLLADMGDHASACTLQDTTYRVCRWELRLCGETRDDHISHSSDSSSHGDRQSSQHQSPMPVNVAVSYNRNSLVVPHARIFNDSSICLSPDGRLLAAFVVEKPLISPSIPTDTLLAVYRLEPKHRRGHCLYSRSFHSSNPVCLDFSPTAEMLIVGLATTRLSSAVAESGIHSDNVSLVASTLGSSNLSCWNSRKSKSLTPVARIFKIDRQNSGRNGQDFARILREIGRLPHPSNIQMPGSVGISLPSVEYWQRHLLLSPSSVSINTLVWCPDGGFIYGTTKGLVVMIRPHAITNVSVSDIEGFGNSSNLYYPPGTGGVVCDQYIYDSEFPSSCEKSSLSQLSLVHQYSST